MASSSSGDGEQAHEETRAVDVVWWQDDRCKSVSTGKLISDCGWRLQRKTSQLTGTLQSNAPI